MLIISWWICGVDTNIKWCPLHNVVNLWIGQPEDLCDQWSAPGLGSPGGLVWSVVCPWIGQPEDLSDQWSAPGLGSPRTCMISGLPLDWTAWRLVWSVVYPWAGRSTHPEVCENSTAGWWNNYWTEVEPLREKINVKVKNHALIPRLWCCVAISVIICVSLHVSPKQKWKVETQIIFNFNIPSWVSKFSIQLKSISWIPVVAKSIIEFALSGNSSASGPQHLLS